MTFGPMNRRGMLAMAMLGGGILCGATLLGVDLARAEKPAIYTGSVAGVALGGYDAVAYFTDGRPAKGSRKHLHHWQGAEWRFASAANRDRFAADPQAYAPRYGGYCAWAVAEGYTAHGDPHAWSIVDGRLYLNYDRRIQRRWERDIAGNISRAESHWPAVLRR